jgi:hypothetical protein
MILGDGRASLTLGPIDRVDEAIRTPMRAHTLGGAVPDILGGDVLLDCDLSAHRLAIGRAKRST